jgi:hypothetical protein
MPDIVQGTKTTLELISNSHGIVRIPLAQSFDYTPQYAERKINELGRTEAVLTISTFNGADIRFDILDSDSKLLDSTIQDVDPASTIVVHDPSNLKKFHAMLNITNEAGVIFEGILAHGVRVKGMASAEPVAEEARITVDGSGQNVRRVKGGAILYNRFVTAATTAYEQANPPNSQEDIELTMTDTVGTFSIALAVDAESNPITLLVLIDGEEADPDSVTITSTTITLDTALDDASVLEVFGVYIPS